MSGNNPIPTADQGSAGRANALSNNLRQGQQAADKLRQGQQTASNLHQGQNLASTMGMGGTSGIGGMPGGMTNAAGMAGMAGGGHGMSGMGGSNMGSNMTSNLPEGAAGAEALRERTYGHSTGRDDSHSGFGGHNTNSNKYGRDMNADFDENRRMNDMGESRSGMNQQSGMSGMRDESSGTHGAQRMSEHMGSGMRDESSGMHSSQTHHMSGMDPGAMGQGGVPSHPHQVTGDSGHAGRTFATRTGINSGAGIHAQQFHGTESENIGTTKTRYVSEMGDNRQIPSTMPAQSSLDQGRGTNVQATEHGHPMGQGKQHGCNICTGAAVEHGHPPGQGQAHGCAECIELAAERSVPGKKQTVTDTKTYEGPSAMHLRPGEVVVEKETRVHRGVVSPGGTTRTEHSGGTGHTSTESGHKPTLKEKLLGKHSEDHNTSTATHTARN